MLKNGMQQDKVKLINATKIKQNIFAMKRLLKIIVIR